jgi:hypothetical protein
VAPRAPERHYWARFGPDIPAESTFVALLKPFSDSFRREFCEVRLLSYQLVCGRMRFDTFILANNQVRGHSR